MKPSRLFALPLLVCLSACGPKPVADDPAARDREIQRAVQERLAEEHKAEKEQQLAARAEELSQREQDIKEREAKIERQRSADSRQVAEPVKQMDARSPAPAPLRGEQPPAQSFDLFYTSLDPDGDWIELGNYGYVFRPTIARNSAWRPYADGSWVYSDHGWMWISNEPFGWATYHYGRWTRARGIGWVWVPGDEWAPAWVSWRAGSEYVGWAPLPPEAEYDDRVGISGWADSTYDIAPAQYSFVTVSNFSAPGVQNTIIASQQNITIINQTVNVTNIKTKNAVVINEGPNFNAINARSSRPLQRFTVDRVTGNGAGPARIKGNRIEVGERVINRHATDTKPAKVRERVKDVAIENGWAGVTDPRAAEQVRSRMNADAITAKAAATPEQQPSPRQVSAQPSVSPQATIPVSAVDERSAARAARAQQLERQRVAPREMTTPPERERQTGKPTGGDPALPPVVPKMEQPPIPNPTATTAPVLQREHQIEIAPSPAPTSEVPKQHRGPLPPQPKIPEQPRAATPPPRKERLEAIPRGQIIPQNQPAAVPRQLPNSTGPVPIPAVPASPVLPAVPVVPATSPSR